MLRHFHSAVLLCLAAACRTTPQPEPQCALPIPESSVEMRLEPAEIPAQVRTQAPQRELSAQEQELVARLAEQNVTLDPRNAWCAIPVEVDIRDDLLEYLLVGPGGAGHESAFTTLVPANVLNVALLSLGIERGTNAVWRVKDPRPSEAEMRAGANPYDITVPQGDGLYLYVGWRVGEDTFFYRVEDVLRDLATGRAMRRHAWIYLGSRMVPSGKGGDPTERFAADVYLNYINVAFFSEGFTLLSAALPECVDQAVWMLNAWLVPERGSRLTLFFSRSRIDSPSVELLRDLPAVAPSAEERR